MKLSIAAGALVLAALVAGCSSAGSDGAPGTPVSTKAPSSVPAYTPPVTPAAPQETTPAAPQYTEPEQQAIDSAESYLSMGTGFSKAGLIHQLDSSAGEGFSEKLAVFAVNHVSVSWRQQAVLSAKGYMQLQSGWSFSGLVQQLDSPYGEQFTYAQAVYAAHAVGL
jgi:hypothetical protein